ncbi:DUF885 family protein [Candidatus Bipolaricaulota bacterium]
MRIRRPRHGLPFLPLLFVLCLPTVCGGASVDEAIARLEGLPYVEFLDASYRELLLRDPEAVTALGLSELFGVRNDRLTDVSPNYVLETQRLEAGILGLLEAYDRTSLSIEETLWCDAYTWYLEALVDEHPFAFQDYPLNGLLTFCYVGQLNDTFMDGHPLESEEDAVDFVARLEAVPTKVEQIIEAVEHRESIGVHTPRFLLESALDAIHTFLGPGSAYRVRPSSIMIDRVLAYERFSGALETIPGLTDERCADLLGQARAILEDHVVSSIWDLKTFALDLTSSAPIQGGATALPGGDALFAHQLARQTSTDLTAQEVHELGLAEVDRVVAEIRSTFARLGYDRNAPFHELWAALDERDTVVRGEEAILAEFQRIYTETEAAIEPFFGLWPSEDVAFAFSPPGVYLNYYSGPPLDRSRPGTYYISGGGSLSEAAMPVIFHHEAVPGHHFQTTIAVDLDLPLFMRALDVNGYIEGWALYCERLTYDLGLFDERPLANLERLSLEVLRAARLVVDTGIHWLGWTREKAAGYIEDLRGLPRGAYVDAMDRYYVAPGQASSYMIGKLTIERLRDEAKDAQGDAFDLAAFHDAILGHGPVPLALLEQVIDRFIARTAP